MATIPVRRYFIGDELEPLQIWWEANGSLVDFSAAHTYEAKLANITTPTTAVFTTTDGFTGAAGSGTEASGTPNLTKAWPTSGELNDVTTAGRYILQVKATRTSDSRERTFHMYLDMEARI